MIGDAAHEGSQVREMPADPCPLPQPRASHRTAGLNGLLPAHVCSTGSFDLRSIDLTALGTVLDSIPLPVLVVDQWHHVVFTNQACKSPGDDGSPVGLPFESLFPIPSDAQRAHELTEKAVLVLENAFESRTPFTAEAILQIGTRRRWYRLHLRSVRVDSERHVLVVMQDLTSERAHQRISLREENRLRNQYAELKLGYADLLEKFRTAEHRLSREIRLRTRAQIQAQEHSEKLLEILRHAPMALGITAEDGSVVYANARFKELFPDGAGNFLKKRLDGTQSRANADRGSGDNFAGIEALETHIDDVSQTSFFAVPEEGGEAREVHVTTTRLSSGEHLVMCAYGK
ncbi:MAG: PAS domain-containing protein [Desulfomonilaceae bacterium]|nr:PAS domain-containing protein [Desulfomonilaceae bacterium]